MSRSPTAILAYLISCMKMELKVAFDLLVKARCNVEPTLNDGFKRQLMELELRIHGKNSVDFFDRRNRRNRYTVDVIRGEPQESKKCEPPDVQNVTSQNIDDELEELLGATPPSAPVEKKSIQENTPSVETAPAVSEIQQEPLDPIVSKSELVAVPNAESEENKENCSQIVTCDPESEKNPKEEKKKRRLEREPNEPASSGSPSKKKKSTTKKFPLQNNNLVNYFQVKK
jgi:hypothetical protein